MRTIQQEDVWIESLKAGNDQSENGMSLMKETDAIGDHPRNSLSQ